MSGLGDFARKAEDWARRHPQQADKGVEEAEKFADERSGHRFDQQIGEGVDQLENRYGGGRETSEARPPEQSEDQAPGQQR